MLEVSMVTLPTKKPLSPPRATPDKMVRASTGFAWGSMKKAARPATPMAHSVARMAISLAPGLRPSKARKKGSIPSSSISRAMK